LCLRIIVIASNPPSPIIAFARALAVAFAVSVFFAPSLVVPVVARPIVRVARCERWITWRHSRVVDSSVLVASSSSRSPNRVASDRIASHPIQIRIESRIRISSRATSRVDRSRLRVASRAHRSTRDRIARDRAESSSHRVAQWATVARGPTDGRPGTVRVRPAALDTS
jgi:hypothetical protein